MIERNKTARIFIFLLNKFWKYIKYKSIHIHRVQMEHEGKALNGHCRQENGSHKHDEGLTNGHKHGGEQDKLVSKFTEKFTLVADDEKSFKNVQKEHTITT